MRRRYERNEPYPYPFTGGSACDVMRYYNSVPLTEAMPVMAPVRGRANHQFTDGYDYG